MEEAERSFEEALQNAWWKLTGVPLEMFARPRPEGLQSPVRELRPGECRRR